MERNSLRLCTSLLWIRQEPWIFSKYLKIFIQLISQRNIRLIIYLDNILGPGQYLDITFKVGQGVIYLPSLGSTTSQNQSVMTATTNIEFLGTLIDSATM